MSIYSTTSEKGENYVNVDDAELKFGFSMIFNSV